MIVGEEDCGLVINIEVGRPILSPFDEVRASTIADAREEELGVFDDTEVSQEEFGVDSVGEDKV